MEHDKVAVLFVDLQEGLVEAARTQPASDVRRGARALAKVCKALALQTFASGIPLGLEGGPPLLREITDELPDIVVVPRQTFGAYPAVEMRLDASTGPPVLVIAGVLIEVAVLRTALDARRGGWEVLVVIDACAGLSERTETAALRQIEAKGGVITCVASLATELVTDVRSPPGGEVMTILRSLLES